MGWQTEIKPFPAMWAQVATVPGQPPPCSWPRPAAVAAPPLHCSAAKPALPQAGARSPQLLRRLQGEPGRQCHTEEVEGIPQPGHSQDYIPHPGHKTPDSLGGWDCCALGLPSPTWGRAGQRKFPQLIKTEGTSGTSKP